jgi:hypothetical protein
MYYPVARPGYLANGMDETLLMIIYLLTPLGFFILRLDSCSQLHESYTQYFQLILGTQPERTASGMPVN